MTSKILDFGNAFLKSVCTGDDTIDIKPSCLYYLTNSDIRNKTKGNEASPLIRTSDDRQFLLGDAAASFGGANNWSLDSKLSVIREGLYASSPVSQAIDLLMVCVPDASIDIDLSNLLGHHSYHYNDRQIQIDVSAIEIVDESLGAFKSAHSHLFNYPDENNVVITCGGGTVNLVVYNGGGNIIHRGVSKDLGMAALAKSIATELKAQFNLSTTPKVSQIMAGIASGVYNLRPHNLDYSQLFEAARSDWKGQFKQFVNDNLCDVDYCEFVVVGGGAELLKSDSITPGIHIPTNSQTYAIEGLMYEQN
ncbi:hypothetical protein [Chamaesiphon sp. OTE_8_metabat_110]|uniref:ParM/StbA family protein n=1 Tax=Chamaesiphon sp. OTE_8_metabat_110 TaxID=2964696 RepID=UPI00286B57CB|nr:hypothetical protein [Chamaesiphon sp. OTE_8_metabat_110]